MHIIYTKADYASFLCLLMLGHVNRFVIPFAMRCPQLINSTSWHPRSAIPNSQPPTYRLQATMQSGTDVHGPHQHPRDHNGSLTLLQCRGLLLPNLAHPRLSHRPSASAAMAVPPNVGKTLPDFPGGRSPAHRAQGDEAVPPRPEVSGAVLPGPDVAL
jgi:hypothetical protein